MCKTQCSIPTKINFINIASQVKIKVKVKNEIRIKVVSILGTPSDVHRGNPVRE